MIKKLECFVALTLMSYMVFAQSGSLDNTFGTNGKVSTGFGRSEAYGNAVAVQPDGKILCGGATYMANPGQEFRKDSYNATLIRYNPDGSRDVSFGDNGMVFNRVEASGADGINTVIHYIKVLDDGRILTYGVRALNALFGGVLLLTMYHPDGSLDISFGNNGLVIANIFPNSFGTPMVIQSDNKIVVFGGIYQSFTDATLSTATWAMLRYNADGSIDSTFGINGQVLTTFGAQLNYPGSLAIQADGKIIASGSRNGPLILARYNTNGSLDNTFDGDGKVVTAFGVFNNSVYLDVLPNGKIQSAGTTVTSAGSHFAITQYNTNGSLDLTFDGDGRSLALFDVNDTSDRIDDISKQADGKYLVNTRIQPMSEFGNPEDFVIRRYNSDGTVDNTFGTNGKVFTALGLGSISKQTTTQADGKILLVGYSQYLLGQAPLVIDFNVLRYNSDGTLDTSLNNDGIISEKVESSNDDGRIVLRQNDGKLLLIGNQRNNRQNSNRNAEIAMARYNQNGSLDVSFGTDGKSIAVFGQNVNNVRKAALQPDGKILVLNEYFVWSNQANGQEVIRFNSDGTLDVSFGTNGKISISTSFVSPLIALEVFDNGSFLVINHGVNPGGNPENLNFILRRFNSNGSLDNGFGDNGWVYLEGVFLGGLYVNVQPDGKIIIATSEQNAQFVSGFRLIRLNSDGSIDSSFENDLLSVDIQSSINALFLEPDGKIIVAGVSTAVNGFYVFNNFITARYNADGSLDTSYGTNGILSTFLGDQQSFLYSIVKSVLRQADGKFLVGLTRYEDYPGNPAFESYDFAVYRFNTNGEYDNNFGTAGKVFTSIFNKYDELFSMVLQDDHKIILAGTTDNGVTRDFALARLENCINVSEEVSVTLCAGETYTINGETYSEEGIYQTTFQNSNGCDSTVTITLFVLLVNNSSQEITLCEGESYTINGETYSEEGIYPTVFQNINGCDSIVTTSIFLDEIQAQVVVDEDELTAVNFPTGASLQWVDCNTNFSAIENETNAMFNPTASGSYAVVVSNGECSETSTCENIIISSVEQLARNGQLSAVLFPNPFEGDVVLRLSGFSWPSHYTLLNTTGQVIRTGSITQETFRLSLNDLASGLYKMWIEDEQGNRVIENLVKQ